MGDDRIYDLVIFGATGFTGQFVVEEALRECSREGKQHRLCVAGRNKERLKAGLEEAGKVCGVAVDSVGVEVADVSRSETLTALASKTRILLSCVGPYREYGFQVASACVSAGTDFLDISGEPEYLEAVQAELTEQARSKGVHVVGSCGFDSVPADMGTVFLQDNFPGSLSYVEMVAGHESADGSTAGIHATTLQCAVLGYANRNRLRANRAKILSKDLPLPPVKPQSRGRLWYHNLSSWWCVPNLASDRSVVMRSQNLLHALEGRQPTNFQAYFGMHSLMSALGAILFGMVFMLMASSKKTRDLMIKYPGVFSCGMFSWAGPDREQLKKQSFRVWLTGVGWSSSEAGVIDRAKPDLFRTCKVEGPDPGYIGTALIVVQCALTLLEEKSKLPARGGVLTPAAAFLHTSLIARLQARGVTFSMVQQGP